MKHKNLILFAITMFYLSITGLNAQTIKDFDGNVNKTVTIGKQEIYNDQTASFTYSAKWKKTSSDIYSQIHQLLDQDLLKSNRIIVELEVYASPNNEGNFLVFDKTKVPDSLTVESLLSEREKVDNDALASSYLTKINLLEIKKINGISMLFEDFSVKSGSFNGRTYAMKTIIGSIIYEFSISGLDNVGFQSDKLYLDNIIDSFSLNK